MNGRRLIFSLWATAALGILSSGAAQAQNKAACDLISKAEAEAVLGVTLLPPKPFAPFRSLLDPDFTKGKPEQGCQFTNFAPNQPKPSKVIDVSVEVRYASTPDPHAIEDSRHQVDTRTYEHPTDLPGLGNAAFWIGPANNMSVFVFIGGTTRLLIGPSEVGLEQQKALAARAVAALGKATFAYGGQPSGLKKPVPGNTGPPAPGIDQLKRALTAKAEAGDVKAQRVLGQLYQYGAVTAAGSAQPDYPGAAYWYLQASDHGDAEAAYRLAILYQNGFGVTLDATQAFHLLQKAAEANYVPAMPLLSDVYADQKTPVSGERATYWASKAAQGGDARGWLILGFEYDVGKLGGDSPWWRTKAMEAYTHAADGGNCLAMIAIADLYAKPRDATQAKNWQAKGESCQGGNAAALQQQIARFKARAAAARDPALYPVLAALPNNTNPATHEVGSASRLPGPGQSDGGFNRSLLVGLAAAAVVVSAAALLSPNLSSGMADSDQNSAAQASLANMGRCSQVSSHGLDPNLFGC